MKVKIINKSSHGLPKYQTIGAAGMDICANLDSSITLLPMERKIIPTGLFIEIPNGYEAQVRPRSGLAIKNGITCLNSPGTIDSDYRGEIGVILANLSTEKFIINSGDRIAQLVVAKHEKVEWVQVEELENSQRGEEGFGSSGVTKN